MKPSRQMQSPLVLSQLPMLLHSAGAWAVLALLASSNQAGPLGHWATPQLAPPQLAKHSHRPVVLLQTPCPLQRGGGRAGQPPRSLWSMLLALPLPLGLPPSESGKQPTLFLSRNPQSGSEPGFPRPSEGKARYATLGKLPPPAVAPRQRHVPVRRSQAPWLLHSNSRPVPTLLLSVRLAVWGLEGGEGGRREDGRVRGRGGQGRERESGRKQEGKVRGEASRTEQQEQTGMKE